MQHLSQLIVAAKFGRDFCDMPNLVSDVRVFITEMKALTTAKFALSMLKADSTATKFQELVKQGYRIFLAAAHRWRFQFLENLNRFNEPTWGQAFANTQMKKDVCSSSIVSVPQDRNYSTFVLSSIIS
jgi:hypothetical protein